jgi:glycosyltransferase involved in cell wall biosynthesis
VGTKLAVYTIALNEEKHVERWYEATKDADYHIIADTGSTDDTVKIAKKLGIQVHNISVKPFRFDDARNAALALVPDDADICLSLDMDEVAEDGLIETIKASWEPDTTRGWLWWETGNKWKNNNRLHARHGYRWIKPCHEVTVKYTLGEEVYIDYDLVVYHKPDDTKSRTYYLPMLEASVKEDPRDARMWHYLVREYFFHKKWDKVVENAFKALQAGGWSVERGAVCRAAGEASRQLGKLEDAHQWFARGVKEAPDQLESWFALAQFFFEVKNWEGCWKAADKVNELKRQNHYLVDRTVWEWRCYDLLGIAGWYIDKKEEAYEYAKKALAANPKDKRLQDNVKWMEEQRESTQNKNAS